MAARDIIQAAAGAAGATEANYIEDCFSCHLYTGNGSTQTITNGIDLATKGGLVWVKGRNNGAEWHYLGDTSRGISNQLASNDSGGQFSAPTRLSGITTTGFTLGDSSATNGTSNTYASWTFAKQPKFFDIVTYTGNGTSGRTIAHSLGSAPGFIITKRTDTNSNWLCYHRSLGFGNASDSDTNYIVLNTTGAQNAFGTAGVIVAANSSTFTPGASANASGGTYVAYLFAHDAGGFGAAGTDSVVSCGSYTSDGSGTPVTVTLGWEPQYLLFKRTDASENWYVFDNMRGLVVGGNDPFLFPNLSNAENGSINYWSPTATGFTGNLSYPGTYIYLAIRRGPMKTPTDATKVFKPALMSTDPVTVDYGFPLDLFVTKNRSGDAFWWTDRLRKIDTVSATNTSAWISSASTQAEGNYNGVYLKNQTEVYASGNVSINGNHTTYAFKRAPGFFDVVCYTGNADALTVKHSLGVVPEMMIVKKRSSTGTWAVYTSATGADKYLRLDNTDASTSSIYYWRNLTPTNSEFYLDFAGDVNSSGASHVAYLFATCPGVSKVGSYTGSGTTKQIDCGFTAGARFVLIKRTDSTGDWYVWDTARGIVSSTDPYLLLNSTAAEVTNTDYIDPYSAGFEISSSAPAAINASGGTFIFLAVA